MSEIVIVHSASACIYFVDLFFICLFSDRIFFYTLIFIPWLTDEMIRNIFLWTLGGIYNVCCFFFSFKIIGYLPLFSVGRHNVIHVNFIK